MTMEIVDQGIMRREPVVATSAAGLESLIGLIHDEYFELADVTFSEDDRVVLIPYRRIFHGDPGRLIRNWLIFRTYEVDVIRSMLTIRNVVEYIADDRSHIGTYSFNTVSYENGCLKIRCCEDCDLRMVMPEIEVESRDLEVRGKSRITHGLLWSAHGGHVCE